MKPRFLIFAPLFLSGCAASSVNSAPVPGPRLVSMPVSSGDRFDYQATAKLAQNAAPLIGAQNDFGARLAARLQAKNDKNENLLVSPTSLWQALALTAGGARGETKNQLSSLLGMQNLPDDKIGAANQAFNTLLAEQKGASISVANSVWFADSFKPNPSFVKGAATNFGAGVELFPSADPEKGATDINNWVSEHTKKEITQIVQKGDVAGQSALLVNAVYFKGGWEDVFSKDATKPAPFHLADGKTIDVPMMNGNRSRAYLSGASFEGVRLPYENTRCALWVLLPNADKKPADVLTELGEEKSKNLAGRGPVIVSLPRFDIEWREELSKELAGMNAPVPFGGGADFSGMGEPTAAISAVLHVCKMRVDEEGTVAAAATAVAVAGSAMLPPAEPKKIKFDRPFVVALVEETSGARLFEGVVNDPSKK
ncbi:serpin family protein [bacterium]|nr:MAG: serpin family protein [bacterium]